MNLAPNDAALHIALRYNFRMSGKRITRMGNHIRAWREHRGLSLEKLGSEINRDKNTVSRWERAVQAYTVADLENLAEKLHCTVFDLLYRNPNDTIDIFKVWADLPDDRRELLNEMLKGLLDKESPKASNF